MLGAHGLNASKTTGIAINRISEVPSIGAFATRERPRTA
jgi:hypothetical protein